MEYNSFYGGRRGASFTIVKAFQSIEAMIAAFSQGSRYTEVQYDEYVIIAPENKSDSDNGKIYRRGYDYFNELGGAQFIGQIQGPAGYSPNLEMDTYENIKNREEEQGYVYYKSEGSYNMQNSFSPGKYVENDVVKYNDEIQWISCSVRDENSRETIATIGFKIPYTVIDYSAETVSPYYHRNNNTDNFINQDLIDREDDGTHPFYEKWHISVPKGIKGDAFKNFRVTTVAEELGKTIQLQDYEGKADDSITDATKKRQILVYDYYHYDKDGGGEPVALFLGDYNMIDNFRIDDDGTVIIDYSHDDRDVYQNLFKWISQIRLNKDTGKFEVIYNYSTDPNTSEPTKYEMSLTWVKDMSIDQYGTITWNYTDIADKTYTNFIKWIKQVTLNTDTGTFEVIYNHSTDSAGNPTKYETQLDWVKDISIDEQGTITFDYTKSNNKIYNQLIKWIDSITLNNLTGIFRVTFNQKDDNNNNLYYETQLRWVDGLNIANDGTITLHYTDNTTVDASHKLKWPTSVSLDTGIVEGEGTQLITVTYNDGNIQTIGNPINYIMRTELNPVNYHLLILHSDPAKRAALQLEGKTATYDGRNDWQDLGSIKSDSGILIGPNIDTSIVPSAATRAGAITYLNTQYPSGLLGEDKGKIVTVGNNDTQMFYAFDYNNLTWYFLGQIQANTILVGEEDDPLIIEQANQMPINSIWFVVEGEDDE